MLGEERCARKGRCGRVQGLVDPYSHRYAVERCVVLGKTHTHKQTNKQTNTHIYMYKDTHTYPYTYTHLNTNTHTHIQTHI